MSKSCKGLLQQLVKCLRESDCVQVLPARTQRGACAHARPEALPTTPRPPALSPQVEGKDIRECAQAVPECAGLRTAYFTCKRGQVDPRSRILGNKGY